MTRSPLTEYPQTIIRNPEDKITHAEGTDKRKETYYSVKSRKKLRKEI